MVPVGLGLGSAGSLPPAPIFYALLDPVHDPLDPGRTVFAHPYLHSYSTARDTILLGHRLGHHPQPGLDSLPRARHGKVHRDELTLEKASSNLVAVVITISVVAMAAFSGPHPVRNSRPAL
jgi:hypothetical protein